MKGILKMFMVLIALAAIASFVEGFNRGYKTSSNASMGAAKTSTKSTSTKLSVGGMAILKKGYVCPSQEDFDALSEAVANGDNDRFQYITNIFGNHCHYYGRDDLKKKVHVASISAWHNSVHIRFYPDKNTEVNWWVLPSQLEPTP
ncbi:MAG: hypothetical protein KGI97_02910 [Alphaproteobacteria bacterium]|nr:hypothetical protein [Alphaproteobacteria bacterium]